MQPKTYLACLVGVLAKLTMDGENQIASHDACVRYLKVTVGFNIMFGQWTKSIKCYDSD